MSVEIKTETVKCPKCGTKTIISKYKQDFCSNCGMELNYAGLKEKRGKIYIRLVIIFIILVGFALLMLVLFPEIFWFIIGIIVMIPIVFVVIAILLVRLLS